MYTVKSVTEQVSLVNLNHLSTSS